MITVKWRCIEICRSFTRTWSKKEGSREITLHPTMTSPERVMKGQTTSSSWLFGRIKPPEIRFYHHNSTNSTNSHSPITKHNTESKSIIMVSSSPISVDNDSLILAISRAQSSLLLDAVSMPLSQPSLMLS